jgi:futalosine hydrolase
MKVLIVAATNEEVAGLKSVLEIENKGSHHVEILITGIGSLSACYVLLSYLNNKSFDLIIQAGICGSVSKNVELGSLVNVVSDQIVDLGASSNHGFINFAESLIQNGQILRWKNNCNHYSHFFENMIQGDGITANICHGDAYWVDYLNENYPNAFESMEGAAFFMVTSNLSISAFQIRAVSNYVEIRNRDSWEKDLAISNLNQFLIKLLNEI